MSEVVDNNFKECIRLVWEIFTKDLQQGIIIRLHKCVQINAKIQPP